MELMELEVGDGCSGEFGGEKWVWREEGEAGRGEGDYIEESGRRSDLASALIINEARRGKRKSEKPGREGHERVRSERVPIQSDLIAAEAAGFWRARRGLSES